jgi:hypothetical protein
MRSNGKAMKLIMFASVGAALFSWHQVALAEDLTRAFTLAEGFSIELPQGWGRIDRNALQASARELFEGLPNSQQLKAQTKQIVDGFQPESAGKTVGYPRILVIADRVGRVSDEDLRQAAHSAQAIQKKADSTLQDNAWRASTKIDEMLYDEEGHFLQVSHATSVPEFGSLYGVNVTFAAEFGLLTFQFTSKQTDYNRYSPVFTKIIRSIRVPSRPRFSASGPSTGTESTRSATSETGWEDILAKSAVGAILVSLLVWQYSRRNRAKQQEPPEAPMDG